MLFSTTTTLITALTLSAFTSAAPTTQSKRSCSAYPWFIAPYQNSRGCSDGNPAAYQPTSGPYNAAATNSSCLPLYDPNDQPYGFESVSINRDACPEQPWNIRLYTEADCSGAAYLVSTDSCVPSPGVGPGVEWTSFIAVLA